MWGRGPTSHWGSALVNLVLVDLRGGPPGIGFWSIRIQWMVSESGWKSSVFLWSGTGFDIALGANVLKNRARSKNSCIHENSSYREVGCVQRFRRLETLSDSYCGNRKVRLQRLRMVHPYPTPKLGISARHAVSNLSGCGGGAPHPIVTPHPWWHARAWRGAN